MGKSIVNAQHDTYSYNNPQPLHEVRAVWLTTIMGLDWPRTKVTDAASIERQKEELCEILDNLQYIHVNTVIIQTRIRGSVIYPSKYEPWDECLTGKYGKNPGYDPLKYCIDQCHARGMECHAWVVAIPVGKAARQKAYGEGALTMRKPNLCRKAGEEVFMLPGNPETANYISNICREIAEKYDVDGISLDYIRYPEKTYNFNDHDMYEKQGSKKSYANWRRDNITRIVRAVHDKVKAVKPWIKLSSSPIGKYRNLREHNASAWNCMD
ncbi:MAG: family 10 glycosylhydrolase, partial [Bacteroidaceae bacterium]|nr:family 10 glycosylhydrolase [Bacteroidaceae bacterium]